MIEVLDTWILRFKVPKGWSFLSTGKDSALKNYKKHKRAAG